jgi:pimeloyl-ACP methyl ester carboxylesterase
VDLSTHIADIVNLIKWEELSDVVLCGHSYAGCVITGVANQIPDRIRALVFLDAFVLENGECFMDIVPSEVARAMRDQAKATGEGWKTNPIPAHILGVRDPRDVAWVDTQCTPQAIATFEERIKLTGNLEHIQDIACMFPPAYQKFGRAEPEWGWSNACIQSARAEADGFRLTLTMRRFYQTSAASSQRGLVATG